MAETKGYTQTISTAEFHDAPRLALEQPTGDVHIEGWDRQEIEVSISDREGLFDIEQSGTLVTVRSRPGSYRVVNFLEPVTEELQSMGIDLERVAAKVERKVERSMRRLGRSISMGMDVAQWAGGRDFYIRVPHRCDVTLRTSSGDISLAAIEGTLFVQSTSGDMRMRDLRGNLVVHSASGDITIDGLAGKLGARTASGTVGAKRANVSEVSINTASGDIELQMLRVPERNCEVRTISGDLTLYLPADARFNAEVATLSGDISCGFPRDQVTYTAKRHRGAGLVVNGGGPTVRLGSTSGDIKITARTGESSAPPAPSAPTAPQAPAGAGEPTRDLARSQAHDEASVGGVGGGPSADLQEPEGYAARRQAELEVLQAVQRGELTPQEAVQKLAELDGEVE